MPSAFETLGDWFRYLKAEGFNAPTQVPWAIQRTQKALELGPDEAVEWLADRGLLVMYNTGVTVDVRATTQDIMSLAEDPAVPPPESPTTGDEAN